MVFINCLIPAGKRKFKKAKAKKAANAEVLKPKPVTPNYFISLQVTNPQVNILYTIAATLIMTGILILQIKERLTAIQEEILEKEARLKRTMVAVSSVHLTLMVMRLDTSNEIERQDLYISSCTFFAIVDLFTEQKVHSLLPERNWKNLHRIPLH
jgi:hypothetical protein